MVRPKNARPTKRFSVTLSELDYGQLEQIAIAQNRPTAQLAAFVLTEFLKNEPSPKQPTLPLNRAA